MDNNLSIREWYMSEFPDDEMGTEINESVTFQSLFEAMDRRKCVYSFLGVYDSLVRERVFSKLSEIMEVDYDYVYDQWLLCDLP